MEYQPSAKPRSAESESRPRRRSGAGADAPASLLMLLGWAFVVFMSTQPFYMQLAGIDPGGGRAQQGSPLPDYVHYLVSAAALGYTVYVGRLPVLIQILTRTPLFLVFFGLGLASALWSENPYLTLRLAFGIAGTIVGCAGMIAVLGRTDSARAFLYGLCLCLVFSLIWSLFLPHYGRHNPNDIYQANHRGKWRGVYMHKNGLGQVGGVAVGCLASYGGRLIYQPVRYATILMGVACLAFAQSASGLLIACVGVGFGFILFQLQGIVRWLTAAMATVFCSLLSGLGSELLSSILIALGKTPTFSGRTLLWDAAAELIADKWMLGYGLAAIFDSDVTGAFSKIGGEVQDANNGYLELAIELGLIGLLLFLCVLVDAIFRGVAARLSNKDEIAARRMMIQVIIMTLFAAVAESSPLMPGGPINALMLAAVFWLATASLGKSQTVASHGTALDATTPNRSSGRRKSQPILELD